MDNKIEIFRIAENQTEIIVRLDKDTVWLKKDQIAELFERDRSVITRHISNIFKEQELDKKVVCAKFAQTTQHGAIPGKTQTHELDFYNLDVIISVGYRVNSKRGVLFRQWATQRLKDYLIEGYAINEKRLAQKQQEVEIIKTGLRIVGRALEDADKVHEQTIFRQFAKGLSLLDDYDHETLDKKGYTIRESVYPDFEEYMNLIRHMHDEFDSKLFAKPKDNGFLSSINQIKQCFNGKDLYPSIEEKAANLLYFITKNHSFVDGNKRIAAACFLYFLNKNKILYNADGVSIINNDTLAMLTLYIANSRTDESEVVKRLIISVLNR